MFSIFCPWVLSTSLSTQVYTSYLRQVSANPFTSRHSTSLVLEWVEHHVGVWPDDVITGLYLCWLAQSEFESARKELEVLEVRDE